ncbi:MAG: YceI family protein [Chloroflexota bacterium]|nr:YceI family protein [Chloroflexota bacterium]
MSRSVLIRLALAVILVGIAAGGGYGLWILFLQPAGPAAVNVSTVPIPSIAASGSGSLRTTPASFDGTWKVDTSIGSFSDSTSSFVGYRVQEQLANIGANTAVGRTPDVSGTLTLQGTIVTAVEVTANLATLKSNDDRRDGQLHRQALETDQFPTATFKLTQPIDLGTAPAEGEAVSVTATGDLTLHGQTKSVQIPLKAKRAGGVIAVTGSLEITFADFGIAKPTSFLVLSVQDHGTLELQLFFTRA